MFFISPKYMQIWKDIAYSCIPSHCIFWLIRFSNWFLSYSFFMMPVGWPSSDSGEYDTWSFWAIYSRVDEGNYGCFLFYHCFKLHSREVVGGSASIDTSYSLYGLTKPPTVWNCGECHYAFDSHVLMHVHMAEEW